MSLLAKAAGTATILRALPRQRRIPFLSREELGELRDRHVRETVFYAAEHVPFYREVFRSAGISPREIRGADDLRHLPLIKSKDWALASRAERQAVNSPVQSTLSNLTEWALVEIEKHIPEAPLCAMIHDAGMGYCPEDRAEPDVLFHSELGESGFLLECSRQAEPEDAMGFQGFDATAIEHDLTPISSKRDPAD